MLYTSTDSGAAGHGFHRLAEEAVDFSALVSPRHRAAVLLALVRNPVLCGAVFRGHELRGTRDHVSGSATLAVLRTTGSGSRVYTAITVLLFMLVHYSS